MLPGRVFQSLQFLIQSQLLIMMEVLDAMAEFERTGKVLEKRRQFLNRRDRRVVIARLRVLFRISIGESLGPGRSQIALLGVQLCLEVVSTLRPIEDLLPCRA